MSDGWVPVLLKKEDVRLRRGRARPSELGWEVELKITEEKTKRFVLPEDRLETLYVVGQAEVQGKLVEEQEQDEERFQLAFEKGQAHLQRMETDPTYAKACNKAALAREKRLKAAHSKQKGCCVGYVIESTMVMAEFGAWRRPSKTQIDTKKQVKLQHDLRRLRKMNAACRRRAGNEEVDDDE